jgi:hypothetical protein
MPSDAVLSDAVDALASGDLSYTELVTLYTDLRTEFTTDAAETVCRRALLGVVGEILDYLDFVEAELERQDDLQFSKPENRPGLEPLNAFFRSALDRFPSRP